MRRAARAPSRRAPGGADAANRIRRLARDPRAQVLHGERVRYVVACAPPGSRIIDGVVAPETFLANAALRLNAAYYVERQIVPALDRALSLCGADVAAWLREIPQTVRVQHRWPSAARCGSIEPSDDSDAEAAGNGGTDSRTHHAQPPRRLRCRRRPAELSAHRTIDQYYDESSHCALCCRRVAQGPLCEACREDASSAAVQLAVRLQSTEERLERMQQYCLECTGTRDAREIACVSLDCPVFFDRLRAQEQYESASWRWSRVLGARGDVATATADRPSMDHASAPRDR